MAGVRGARRANAPGGSNHEPETASPGVDRLRTGVRRAHRGLRAAGHVVVQQALRTGANDPQVQLAEDGTRALDAGAAPASLVGPGSAAAGLAGPAPVEPSVSLAPFIVVYDAAGAPLAGNATLFGGTPKPPAGVLETADRPASTRSRRQPGQSARIAAVVVGWSGARSSRPLAAARRGAGGQDAPPRWRGMALPAQQSWSWCRLERRGSRSAETPNGPPDDPRRHGGPERRRNLRASGRATRERRRARTSPRDARAVPCADRRPATRAVPCADVAMRP